MMLKRRKLVRRAVLHEYLPWGGILAAWAAIVLGLGVREAALVAVGLFLVNSARALAQVSTAGLLMRFPPGPAGSTALLRAVRLANLAALAFGLALILGGVALLAEGRLRHVAEIGLLIALGFPARYGVRMARRPRSAGTGRFRTTLAWTGAALSAAALAAGAGWQGVALAFALREWVACAAIYWPPRAPLPASAEAPAHPWAAIAIATHAVARRRFASRAMRSLLAGFLGPLGTGLARTGRAARIDRRITPHVPESLAATGLLAAVPLGAGIVLLLAGTAFWQLLLGASLVRTGASASALFFWGLVVRAIPDPVRGEVAALRDPDEDD